MLVMGPLTDVDLRAALAADGDVVIWDERQLRAVLAAGGGRVHVKLDTGMGRLGTRDVEKATQLAGMAAAADGVELVGAMTHFATADELSDGGFFAGQLKPFREWVRSLRAEHPGLLAHAANSAATLREPSAQFDMVRCGVSIYGMDPFGQDPEAQGLEPALELSTYVADVKRAGPGESVGYGRRFVAERDTLIGVLPIGYGDGWRRGLTNNADVLVAGSRHPLVGTVSMDSVAFDAGANGERLLNEPAVLIGEQGDERITAEEVARRLGTINYEITCGLTRRVPREYHRDGAALELPLDADPGVLGAAGAR
jgi:alanine racemase